MLRRSGTLRRTGFKRPTYVPPPSPPVTRGRGGVIRRIDDTAITIQKENVVTSLVYQARVRKLPCARCGIVGFSQFCHSDEGKGMGIKTDDRRGWPGCGPHLEGGQMVNGCHWFVGTSGSLKQSERRELEARMSAETRLQILRLGLWPKSLPLWEADAEVLNANSIDPSKLEDAIKGNPEIVELIVNAMASRTTGRIHHGTGNSL